MNAAEPQDIVRLTTAPNPAQAHIWKQALIDEGITCSVVGDYLNAGVGNISGLLPELWVRREDATRAEEVLLRHQHPSEDQGESA
ncbi:MAG: DUF2007 domain-containing protein [Planctomycetia bacterium]|nr:DUF2007 domain-containing protein [Planctomycetia bacterium]